jgi:hypothetical protein
MKLISENTQRNLNRLKKKHQSYLKFTGETAMVLFASKRIVPFKAGSFLLVLKHKKTSTS